MEGPTERSLIRSLLTRLYGATERGPLVVSFPPGSATGLGRSYEANRAKYGIEDTVLGLHVAGGKDKARLATRRLLWGPIQGVFPTLRILVLVRDLDTSEASALHQGLSQQLRELADGEGAGFESLGSGPWLCRVHNVAVGQILLGDPSTSGNPAIEDHILDLLKCQPNRDPTKLTPVVGNHLQIDLGPKQQVLLAMVKDEYWTAAAGFYERVLASASDDQLRALAERLGFTELMERITEGPMKG